MCLHEFLCPKISSTFCGHQSECRNWTLERSLQSRIKLNSVANEDEILAKEEDQKAYFFSEEDGFGGPYAQELKVATQAVQLAVRLSQGVQDKMRASEFTSNTKADKSPVTLADWGVQAVVNWVLQQSFPHENISIIAEEDTKSLKNSPQLSLLLPLVNNCLSEATLFGLAPLALPLTENNILEAIQTGSSQGGPTGRHWVLDPVDGTLGFLRGDQYAIALAMVEDGRVVLGVLACPNYPVRTAWLRYAHRYLRLAERLCPPPTGAWTRGMLLRAARGGHGVWMEPTGQGNGRGEEGLPAGARSAVEVRVSGVVDPSEATFCEPVEKSNTSQEFSKGIADDVGLKNRPLRVYSMAKYAAIAKGDAEIFMKFARGGYREKVWDHAAGVVLVEEAGGVVTDAGGRALDFSRGRFLEGLDRGIIATCSSAMHEAILKSVDDSWESSRL